METVKGIVTLLGVIGRVGGLIWILMSYIDFSSAKKNNEGSRQDAAVWGMILGAALTATAPTIAASINAALDSITL
ncbi:MULTISPECIES: hypothetical protein [Streptococcus]|nr:hypothetical protein [Streptococcus suis]MBM7316425.1 hypothetical protein [Streptococcus suis]MCL4922691.1 hypothetical protein [Streptococcus suis]MDD7565872.1 hypothetical protein [Streptococcus suis]MDY5054061.1 hypothetical protein [Streptococcus suis]HEM2785987.1 hypothetical protein [Streptococcus suis]